MNRKKISFIIFSIISSILIFTVLRNYTSRNARNINLPPLNKEHVKLNKKDYVEDFDYVYNTLETYYPYFDINKKVNGIDWLNNRQKYRTYIGESTDDSDFFHRMNKVLFDLNNKHTHLVDLESGLSMYVTYYNTPTIDWRNDISKIYENPLVQNRYKITNKKVKDYLKYNHYQASNDLSKKGYLFGANKKIPLPRIMFF